MNFIEWLLTGAIAVTVLVVGFKIYDDVVSEKITLNKSEWVCSHSEKETHTRPQLVGKVTVMVPYTTDVCQIYERKK